MSLTQNPQMSKLEALPSELIYQILVLLESVDLSKFSQTSRLLKSRAEDELLWESLVRGAVGKESQLSSPHPAATWRDLYIAHHPYWFIVRNKVWHSDRRYHGGLLLSRFDSERGEIQAFQLRCHDARRTAQNWPLDPSILTARFRPHIYPWLGDPVIKLEYAEPTPKSGLQKEVRMPTGRTSDSGNCTLLSLCSFMPPSLEHPSMFLWPPQSVPALHRVRNQSASGFRSAEQRPSTLATLSDRTFRTRYEMRMSSLMSIAVESRGATDQTQTWNALLEESYKPTKDKPWQGIWIGDYSSHGPEFILVLQHSDPPKKKQRRLRESSMSNGLPAGFVLQSELEEDADGVSHQRYEYNSITFPAPFPAPSDEEPDSTSSGRLEAIKLTGDPNVPRGEYTWFADDISDAGLIRMVDDPIFGRGRVVRCMGHIANTTFKDDRYIPTQLILEDLNNIAQYWEAFENISRYKRVDIDKLITTPPGQAFQP